MIKYIAVFIFSVFISSVSQVLLKTSTKEKYGNLLKEYLNFKVIIAYFLFFCSSLLTVLAYKYVPLSMGMVLESSGYIFITGLGYFWLHEKIGKRTIIGICCILFGILVFYV